MGCGRVGSSLARNLERAGHTVSIIDQNPAAFRRLGPDFAGDQVTGVGFDRDTLSRAGIDLFAIEYPHDYPEVEATLVALRSGLRLTQVQVQMRERETGASSITFVRSLYYIVKVMLALLVASIRRYPRLETVRR